MNEHPQNHPQIPRFPWMISWFFPRRAFMRPRGAGMVPARLLS
jgi:hypothetical protein